MRGAPLARSALELVFPGRCLLCGDWLLFRGYSARDRVQASESPLCTDCRKALSPIAGNRCRTCGSPLVSEQGVCTRCRRADFSFESNLPVFLYAGAMRILISKYKFEGRRRLAGIFAIFFAQALASSHPGLPVVPVPPRPLRRRIDSVELIARRLETRHDVTVLRLLQRAGGPAQKALDFPARRENLRGRIRPSDSRCGVPIPPEVVLIDDVFTTGATADACARALRELGCRKVFVVTLAVD